MLAQPPAHSEPSIKSWTWNGIDLALHFYNYGLYSGAGIGTITMGSLMGCLSDNLLTTEANDRWRDEIVWKGNVCLERRRGVTGREQACIFPFFLSSSVFTCRDSGSAGICKCQLLLFVYIIHRQASLRMFSDE